MSLEVVVRLFLSSVIFAVGVLSLGGVCLSVIGQSVVTRVRSRRVLASIPSARHPPSTLLSAALHVFSEYREFLRSGCLEINSST